MGDSTAALWRFDSNFTDSVAGFSATLAGTPSISTSVKKYGAGSLNLKSGDSLEVNSANTRMTIGTSDFCIECWVLPDASLSTLGSRFIVDFRDTTENGINPGLSLQNLSLRFGTGTNSGFTTYISGSTLSSGVWQHVAVARAGTTTRMFLDGVQVGIDNSDTRSYTCQPSRPRIGRHGNTVTNTFIGNFDDLRISIGSARYIANFTPPGAF